jgi:membrane-associated phospholipid phosphatase
VGKDPRRLVLAFTSIAAAFALLAGAGIIVLDRPLAEWAAAHPRSGTMWSDGLALLDTITLSNISKFLLGPVLLIAGGVLLLLRSTRRTAWMLIYVGAVQFAATMLAHLTAPLLGRQLPLQAMANPGARDLWFSGGRSLPAEDVVFYAGLFLPLMLIFPRWTFALAVPPLFVAAARIISGAHYLSDAAAAFAVAALVTGGLAFIRAKADDYW